jgi:hypothetical protein
MTGVPPTVDHKNPYGREPREQPEPDGEQQQRGHAGRDQVGTPRRVAVQRRREDRRGRQRGVRADQEVRQRDRDERVREPVDRAALGVGLAGARLGAGGVPAERPPERDKEGADAEPPPDRAHRADDRGNVVEGRERETGDPQEREREVDGRRAGDRQLPVEVRGDERVGLPEQGVEGEPVEPEDDERPSGETGEVGRQRQDERRGAGEEEPPCPGRDRRRGRHRAVPSWLTPGGVKSWFRTPGFTSTAR